VRRAYRPKTPEGAANSSYVHFLFGLIFKYEATTEQGHRSQGLNDTARARRRGNPVAFARILDPLRARAVKAFEEFVRPAVLDRYLLALDITGYGQALADKLTRH
jgi:hypothetical protein